MSYSQKCISSIEILKSQDHSKVTGAVCKLRVSSYIKKTFHINHDKNSFDIDFYLKFREISRKTTGNNKLSSVYNDLRRKGIIHIDSTLL